MKQYIKCVYAKFEFERSRSGNETTNTSNLVYERIWLTLKMLGRG